MAQFAYSFCISMLHSFWQSTLLFLLYFVFTHLFKTYSPIAKRNFIFVLLCLQALLFSFTFCIYFFNINYSIPFSYNAIDYLPLNNLLIQSTNWLFAVYCVLFFYKSISTLYSFIYFKKNYTSSLQKPPIDLRLFTTQKAFHLGIKKKVSVWYSKAVTTPITFGFFKPVILLPISLVNNISLAQTETLLLHELAHIKANDYILNWITVTIETIFFFNPFIVALCKQLKLQRELHCDATVITYNYSPILYAEALLIAAKHNKLSPTFSLAAITTKKQLLKRILFFTAEKNMLKNKTNLLLPMLLLVVYLFLFLLITPTVVSNKASLPTTKELQLFPVIGLDADLSFTTEPITTNNKTIATTTSTIKLVERVVKNKKVVEKKSKESEPVLTEEVVNLTPVSFPEKEDVQQIVIEEQQSGNKPSVLAVYNLIYKNGKWFLQPQWMISKSVQDTSKKLVDSTQPLIPIESTQ